MTPLLTALRHTLCSRPLLSLMYGITLIMGLVVALPFYNTLIAEDQNSLAFLKLLNGFDYTVFSDFIHRSKRSILPLMSVGRWLGLTYVFLSVFFAGGILTRFTQLFTLRSSDSFTIGMFWQGCSYYVSRFIGLFGVTLLFVVIGSGIWLVLGTLIGVVMSDTLTERGQFWIGFFFFWLSALTATFLLCIGDYAKVIMVREEESNPFRAFGRAGRLVVRNPGKTYGLYCLLILIGAGLFGIYFLIDAAVMMSGWLTIVLMFIVQQALIVARVVLKVWSLGTAYTVYENLFKFQPVPVPKSIPDSPQELAQSDEDSRYTSE